MNSYCWVQEIGGTAANRCFNWRQLTSGSHLGVGDGREGLLCLGVEGGEGQQRGDAQGDAGGGALRRDPEADPGHDHDEDGGDVGGEHQVARAALHLEHGGQAGEGPGGVVHRAVLYLGRLYLKLRQPKNISTIIEVGNISIQ